MRLGRRRRRPQHERGHPRGLGLAQAERRGGLAVGPPHAHAHLRLDAVAGPVDGDPQRVAVPVARLDGAEELDGLEAQRRGAPGAEAEPRLDRTRALAARRLVHADRSYAHRAPPSIAVTRSQTSREARRFAEDRPRRAPSLPRSRDDLAPRADRCGSSMLDELNTLALLRARDQARALLATARNAMIEVERPARYALVALLADGHLLLEDVPGVGKTTLARIIARTIGGHDSRIQCTADLSPRDVIGQEIQSDNLALRPNQLRSRPAVRERRGHGRDQPRDADAAVGPLRGDGGAVRHASPRSATRCRARSSSSRR